MNITDVREASESRPFHQGGKLPCTVYRCKGIIYAVEDPDRRSVWQVVGRRTDVAILDEWGIRKPRTRIVAISAPGGIDEEALHEAFEACISPVERELA